MQASYATRLLHTALEFLAFVFAHGNGLIRCVYHQLVRVAKRESSLQRMNGVDRQRRKQRAAMTWMFVCLGASIWLGSVHAGTGRTSLKSRPTSFVPRQDYDDAYSGKDGTLVLTIPATWIVASRESSVGGGAMTDDDGMLAPRICIRDMASALSWTTQWNDRLQECSAVSLFRNDPLDHLRGGGVGILASERPRSYRIPLTQPLPEMYPGSVWRMDRRISSIELSQFLRQVLTLLMESRSREDATSGDSLVRTLALLYLDRACSVTLSERKLPFLSRETVHALSLTSLLVAWGAVHGDLSEMALATDPLLLRLYHLLEVNMGISAADTQRRVACMLGALQVDEEDDGMFVTPTALQEWNERWLSRFASQV
jgi:hypothetical protein